MLLSSVYKPDVENKFGFEADVGVFDSRYPYANVFLIRWFQIDRRRLLLWLQQERCRLAPQTIKDPHSCRLDLQLAR